MKTTILAACAIVGVIAATLAVAQTDHDHMKGMDMPKQTADKSSKKSALQPAEGAAVKIISPKVGVTIKGDKVPLQFKLTKGKRGEHVHAYIDGEMVGMFSSEKGTLNGIKPGKHSLELRVTTTDHNTELDATDKITFTTK
jgi:transcription antitermination factor NusG